MVTKQRQYENARGTVHHWVADTHEEAEAFRAGVGFVNHGSLEEFGFFSQEAHSVDGEYLGLAWHIYILEVE